MVKSGVWKQTKAHRITVHFFSQKYMVSSQSCIVTQNFNNKEDIITIFWTYFPRCITCGHIKINARKRIFKSVIPHAYCKLHLIPCFWIQTEPLPALMMSSHFSQSNVNLIKRIVKISSLMLWLWMNIEV